MAVCERACALCGDSFWQRGVRMCGRTALFTVLQCIAPTNVHNRRTCSQTCLALNNAFIRIHVLDGPHSTADIGSYFCIGVYFAMWHLSGPSLFFQFYKKTKKKQRIHRICCTAIKVKFSEFYEPINASIYNNYNNSIAFCRIYVIFLSFVSFD